MWAVRLWPLLAAVGWCIFFATAVAAPVELGDSYIAYLFAAPAGLAILMLVLLSGTRPRWPAWGRWLMFGCGLVLVGVPFAFNLHAPSFRAAAGLGLVLVALPVGYWIGDRMEKVTNLIPLAVAMSGADVFSVYQGPSHAVTKDLTSYYDQIENKLQELGPSATAEQVEQATAVLRAPLGDYLVVHMPVPGTHFTQPVLGIGDFIVLAFIFRAVWLHRLNPAGVFGAGLASVLLALVISNQTSQALPALPLIALGVVGYLWVATPRIRKLDRQEIVLSWGVALLFSALILAKWLTAVLQH